MDLVCRAERFVESWFSGFRLIIENSFIKVNYDANAEVILHQITSLDVDKDKIINKLKTLSEDEWSQEYLMSTLKEFDSMIGISDEFLRKNAVQNLNETDLVEIKWEIMKRMMIDYAKFTKEFYDTLKYSQNQKLERERYLLMIELMDALKKIHTASKSLVDKFSQKKYNNNSFKKFMNVRIALEHLMLRILYILVNIDNKDKLSKYRDVLSREITEYAVHQIK
jgi:hypothetical protein